LGLAGNRRFDKDTLANVRSTGEFVVNIVTEDLAEKMTLTSGEYPADVDEFAMSG
jgi:flavin reductase (DIM6/NTAB) family NADH-FMN oxidoreductase RutF